MADGDSSPDFSSGEHDFADHEGAWQARKAPDRHPEKQGNVGESRTEHFNDGFMDSHLQDNPRQMT